MIYIGRVGGGYFWALGGRGGVYYLYERSSATRWRTVYRGRVSALELVRRFGAVLKPQLPAHWYEVLRAAVGALLARLSPRERRRLAEEYGDLLDYFGYSVDDGG